MKRVYLTMGALLVWSTSALAGAGGETVTIPADDYKAIMQQLKSLQQRVDTLESKGKVAGDSAERKQAAAIPGKLEKDVQNIYSTLDTVETKTLKDRINLGAELRTRVDDIEVKNMNLGAAGFANVSHTDNHWTNRFRLNMDAEIRKNLLFTGRLTAYKNFADNTTNQLINDANQGHVPGDSGIKLDRAYVDWIPEGMPVPLAFTFGRHPSSEGPPQELKENRKRQSTYPSLLFDGEADGVVATVGLERYLGWKQSGLRFAWGKAYQDDSASISYLDNYGGALKDSNIYAMFFETEIPGVKDSLLVLSALRASNLPAESKYIGDANNTSKATIGDMDMFGIHAQANRVADSNFDVFLSTGLNRTHPNGYITFDPGTGPQNYGLLTTGLDAVNGTSHTGWAVYAGTRYNIQSKALNDPKVGFEFNHGSDYWFSFTWGSSELYNKLATRGNVYDLYYIQPFNENLFARLGVTYIDYNYNMSGLQIGDWGGNTDASLRDVYFLLDCRF